nr:hypothetical protein CFP56_04404 [Quercus suber]
MDAVPKVGDEVTKSELEGKRAMMSGMGTDASDAIPSPLLPGLSMITTGHFSTSSSNVASISHHRDRANGLSCLMSQGGASAVVTKLRAANAGAL